MDTFIELSIILALATVVALVMQRLKLPLILGHILTGVAAGPLWFDIIRSEETITIFSKLGITALLFIVGLSLRPKVVREVGRVAVVAGVGQVVITTVLGFLLARAFGIDIVPSVYLAIALTFSSTIIISKILSDKNDIGTLYGKIAIGILLVQDVIATGVLIIISTLNQGGALSDAFFIIGLKTAGLGFLLYVVSVFILPRLTKLFAESQEFLFLFSIGWGVGLAAIFHLMGLSVEIGALLAGVTLASSPYQYEISAKMKLLRDFFIILFFVSLGAQLEFGDVQMLAWPAAILSLFVLIGNPLIVMTIMGLMGYSKKTGFFAGLSVAQISEFSLLLVIIGVGAGQVPHSILALTTIVGIVTFTLSAILLLNAESIYRFIAPALSIFERRGVRLDRNRRERIEAVLFGCHRVGQDFLPSLVRLNVPYLVVDFDPAVIQSLEEKHIPCRYGDAEDNEFLDELGLKRLKVVVSTLPDFDANACILSKLRKVNPDAIAILMAHTVEEAQLLYRDGASYVILPHFLGGNHAALMMDKFGDDLRKYAVEAKRHLAHLEARSS